jgi:hypothetical protein
MAIEDAGPIAVMPARRRYCIAISVLMRVSAAADA